MFRSPLLLPLALCALALGASPAHADSVFGLPIDPLNPNPQCGFDSTDCYVKGQHHTGADYWGDDSYSGGDPIFAMADGVVTTAREEADGQGFGNVVVLRHELSDGRVVYSVYGHFADRPMVGAGQCVRRGTQLGVEGATGAGSGAHVHVEVKTTDGLGPEYGYSPEPARQHGYFDPNDFIGKVSAKDICSARPWNAAFVAQRLPQLLVPGQSGDFEVQLRNVGTETWRPGEVFLGTQREQDSPFPFADASWGPHRNRVSLAAETAPGQIGRFVGTWHVPADSPVPRRHIQYFDVVAERKAHFGAEIGIWLPFFVGDASRVPFDRSDYGSQLVAQSSVPDRLRRGDRVCVTATYRNSGIATLFRDGAAPVRLRGTDNQGKVNDRQSLFVDGFAPNAVEKMGVSLEDDRVAPGGEYTFRISLRIPDDAPAGRFVETFRPVAETKAWFGQTVQWTLNVVAEPATGVPDHPACFPPPPVVEQPPIVSSLSIAPRVVRSGRRARIAFAVNEAGTAAFTVVRLVRCSRRARRRAGARCPRAVRVRSFTRPAAAGANRLVVRARSRRGRRVRPLPAGRYRLALRVTDAAGLASAPKVIGFRIRRGRR